MTASTYLIKSDFVGNDQYDNASYDAAAHTV
jgi:hypothetical protein